MNFKIKKGWAEPIRLMLTPPSRIVDFSLPLGSKLWQPHPLETLDLWALLSLGDKK